MTDLFPGLAASRARTRAGMRAREEALSLLSILRAPDAPYYYGMERASGRTV